MANPNDPSAPINAVTPNTDQVDALGAAYARTGMLGDNAAKNNIVSFAGLYETLKNVTNQTGGLGKGFSDVLGSLGRFKGEIADVKLLVGDRMFDGVSESARTMSSSASDSFAALKGDLDALGSTSKTVAKMIELARAIGEQAAQGQKAEAAYAGMLGASGKLNTAFDQQTGVMRDLGAMTAEYNQKLLDVASSTGFTAKQIMPFMQQLNSIPGMMNSMVQGAGKGGQALDAMTTALRLASGSGQSDKEVMDAMKIAYESLGNAMGKVTDPAQKGAELFATTVSIAQAMNITFQDSAAYLKTVAETFKYTGDNTEAATKILETYGGALQNTGLTAKASTELVDKMVQSTHNMTLGQEAFISARGGGPGGLEGAFKLEELQRQGKDDQVMAMAQKAFKGVAGGKIYTQQEAAQSPQARAGFARQRALLQSGAFGIGKGMGNDEANRVLEAMKSGNVEQFKIATKQDAVKSVAEKGNQIQERNTTYLTLMANSSERTAISVALMAAKALREGEGTQGVKTQADAINQITREAEARVNAATEKANTVAPKNTAAENMPERDLGQTIDQLKTKGISDFTKSAAGVFSGFGNVVKNAVGQQTATTEAAPAVIAQPAPTRKWKEDLANLQANTAQAAIKEAANTTTAHATRAAQLATQAIQTNQRAPVAAALAAHATQTQSTKQDVTLHISISAPKGFDAQASTADANVKIDAIKNISRQIYSGGT